LGVEPGVSVDATKPEKEGIHVHAFRTDDQAEPTLDDTFREVTIDGIRLDPVTVRVLMAQNVMPSAREPRSVDELYELRSFSI
jgi:hypothetical protein